MGRSAVACRARSVSGGWEESGERLEAQNAALREQLAEVEGWYRLLQADHSALQARDSRQAREATGLRTRVNQLEVENQQLQDIVSRQGEADVGANTRGDAAMNTRVAKVVDALRRYKWAAVAALSLGTLAARDPWVARTLETAREKVAGREDGRDADGFVRYAEMVRAREEAEAARRDYNEREATLKGDALLEAQDRLRAAKARDRRARLDFLPELARRCESAGVPLPRQAADDLLALKTEARD